MKKLFFLLFLYPVFVCGQGVLPRTEKVQSVNFNILGLQYNYELPLSRLTTVNLHGGLGSDLVYRRWSAWGGDTGSEWGYSFRGVAGADFRYFYNLDHRAAKGKNTRLNSGNFFSLDMIYVSKAIYSKNFGTTDGILIIPAYGLRRVYKSGWLIEPRIGYSIEYNGYSWGGGMKVDFKVGYSF